MTRLITWPAPLKINNIERSAQEFITELVMARDYWRESYELITIADSICEELLKGGETSSITMGQSEKLLEAMKLKDNNITPPAANHFYLKLMRAVHTAKDI